MLEAKVRKYLEQTVALQTYWKTAVTDETLQRELERMAQGTRMPERLQEVYAALGNDTFLIKECVARATLVDRLTRNFFAFRLAIPSSSAHGDRYVARPARVGRCEPERGSSEPNGQRASRRPRDRSRTRAVDRFQCAHRQARGQISQARCGQATSPIVESRDGFAFDVVLSENPTTVRVATPTSCRRSLGRSGGRARMRRSGPSPWSRSPQIACACRQPTKGSTFDPNAACTGDGWNDGVLDDLPEARAQHSAVWTGSLMLVWGGTKLGSALLKREGALRPGDRHLAADDDGQRAASPDRQFNGVDRQRDDHLGGYEFPHEQPVVRERRTLRPDRGSLDENVTRSKRPSLSHGRMDRNANDRVGWLLLPRQSVCTRHSEYQGAL